VVYAHLRLFILSAGVIVLNTQILLTLEYDRIKAMLADLTLSGLGRELVERLKPMTRRGAIEAALLETTEAQALLAGGAQVPLRGLADVRQLVERAEKGGALNPAELVRVADCLRGCRELKRYMESKRLVAPNLSRYAEAIAVFRALEDEIYLSIDGSRVSDAASPRLARIRKEIHAQEERIQAKLQSFLTSHQYRGAIQESFVSIKDGHYVLPIKASHRHKVDGLVIDTSGSKLTVFVEPTVVRMLTNERQALKAEEEAEEYQVLMALSGLLAAEARPILINLEVMAAYDFALAKGRLSLSMGGRSAAINDEGFIQIIQGRHPLIPHEAVPLDLTLGRRYRTLVITGPNTGGKTVALKTVGLMTLMIQSGLHVPVGEGSRLAVFEGILADIGDGQSIEQSLSTFSSHMGRIASILRQAGRSSLVLLDEIGTGTDPAEGAALAMAILEELHESGAVTLATTHYSDVKRLADLRQGFINGRMDFDPETLKPLYRLVMGEAGSSHAFWIAQKLGIGRKVLELAEKHLQEGHPQALPEGQAGFNTKQPEAKPGLARNPAPSVQDQASGGPSTPEQAADDRRPWQIGDSVMIQTIGQTGVVAELPNARGEMVIFTRGKRITVNHKRVTLLVSAEHLYPEGYDLRTATYTWKDRKLMHNMERKHVNGSRIISEGSQE